MLPERLDPCGDIDILIAFKVAHTVAAAEVKFFQRHAKAVPQLRHKGEHYIHRALIDVLIKNL